MLLYPVERLWVLEKYSMNKMNHYYSHCTCFNTEDPSAICIPHLEVPSFRVGPVPFTERANDGSISRQFWLC